MYNVSSIVLLSPLSPLVACCNKWLGKNSFKFENDYKGIKLQFTCGHQKDGCIAECEWSSLGMVLHNGQYHVVFSITFKSDLDTVLNKHIHPQGCQAHSSKTFPDIPECCQIDIEILPAPFKAFATRAVNKVIHIYVKQPACI